MSLLPDFSKLKVLVVGDVMLDRYWHGDVERISPEAPVPVLSVQDIEERAGGAANVALNVAALGAQCRLLSVVGSDDAGKRLVAILTSSGIDAPLIEDSSVVTTVKLRMLSKHQQLIRADFEGQVGGELLTRCMDQFQKLLQVVDVIILSDYGKGGLTHVATMIELARDAGVLVFVDPKGHDFSKYKGASLITPNLKEFEVANHLASYSEADDRLDNDAMKMLRELELECLLVTLGERGMKLFSSQGATLSSPSRSREVYDVSGAGDTVIAAMAVTLAAGLSHENAMEIANTAAGIVISKLGAAVATHAEINTALKARS